MILRQAVSFAIIGQLPPKNYNRQIMLFFDNTPQALKFDNIKAQLQQHLQPKRFVYWVACGVNVTLADDAVGAARTLEYLAADDGPKE